jgi:hypothetical protein
MQTHQRHRASKRIKVAAIFRKGLWKVTLGMITALVLLGACGRGNLSRNSPDTSDAFAETGLLSAQPELTPTATYLPTELPQTAIPQVIFATPTVITTASPISEQPSTLPLPTVTPTTELLPAAARDVEISGATTMRLSLSGEGFDSTGSPIDFSIEPRHLTVGGDIRSVSDRWCVQLGLVNEIFDLNMHIDPATEDIVVSGSITLSEGFCEASGETIDTVSVELSVPTDAVAQISYNLSGRRSLFGVTGLLDSDTGAIVELRITNSRPE